MTLSPTLLLEDISAARSETDRLFDLIRPEFLYERPVAERHRLIFYVGHLEAFDWNVLARRTAGMASFFPKFDQLFEAGIDPEPGQLPSDPPSAWPDLAAVLAYRDETRRRVDALIDQIPPEMVRWGIEHRLMHAETLAYLFHNLPFQHKRPVSQLEPLNSATPLPSRMLHIPAGLATLGQQSNLLGWDNEFPQHTQPVAEFLVSQFKVTNGEYLAFVSAGAPAPHFWLKQDGQWFYRGMFEAVPLPLDWPVYVTQAEATAYAQWAGSRLMTESEYHRAAYGQPDGSESTFPWGSAAPSPEHGNFNFVRFDPEPVTAHPAGDSAFGVSQLAGNGWEWTSTPFAPFDGFQSFDFYPEYSANFFDNAHFVIKGGSPRTASCFLRRSFRNWFRPTYPYVYATFRLVKD